MDIKDNSSLDSSIKKERSAAYPSITIMSSVDIGRKIYTELGSSNFNPRETIAQVLGRSPASIQTDLSTLVQYGLLEMKSKIGYKPTQLLKNILKPLQGEDTTIHLLECLKSPKLYVNLITDLQGEIVPGKIGLANMLCRNYGITEKASETAAEVLLTNLQELNLLDSDNSLVLKVNTEGENGISITKQEPENKKSEVVHLQNNYQQEEPRYLPPVSNQAKVIDVTEMGIPLKSGKVAKLIMSNDLDDTDLDRIISLVRALKSTQ